MQRKVEQRGIEDLPRSPSRFLPSLISGAKYCNVTYEKNAPFSPIQRETQGETPNVKERMFRWSIAACLLAAASLFVLSNDEARCEDARQKMQILFIGNTQGLLEPCG